MIEKFICPNCGKAPWIKTVAHYMCLKCGNLCLHNYAIEMGFVKFQSLSTTVKRDD